MKKIHLVLAFTTYLITNITTVKAQEKCKYDIDKKDAFSGKQIRSIKTPILFTVLPVFNWQLFLNKIGDDYNIETAIVLPGTIPDFLEKGDSIMFKFDNGKIVTCYAKDRIAPRTTPKPSSDREFFTSYQVSYPISVDNMKSFTTSLVTNIQMNTGVRFYQREISEKNSKKILKSSVCIMQ